MSNIRDVAKQANVAPSTVSLVLNKTGYVSAEIRKRVNKAIEELNYTPNELGRNLSQKRSNIVGVTMYDITHPFCNTLVKYIELYLSEYGYKTMLCCTSFGRNTEREYLYMLKRHALDGIIANVFSANEPIETDRPLVLIDSFINENIPIVMSDHHQEGRLAASLFIENGCKHVVHLTVNKVMKSPAYERNNVLEQILNGNGIRTDAIELSNHSRELNYFSNMSKLLFDRYPDVDGIFGSEIFICECLKQAKIRKIRVPDDLKMVACDGTYLSELNDITAIVQPFKKIAKKSVDIVVGLAAGEQISAETFEFKASVLKGKTTAV
jgi:LacI family transcriptional regulator, sucrose operon repressor